MKILKGIIKKILNPHTHSNNAFVKYIRNKGVTVGENTYFFSPQNTTIDTQNALFISIGANCKITKGCTILAHDYSYSIFRPIYHTIPKKAGITKIGNNCFIGINSIILMGSHIGDNCIIGAGSVVSGTIPDNQVWAGNPARFICTLEEYYKKCMDNYEKNAFLVADVYKSKKGRYPNVQEFQYFSLLFLNNDSSQSSEKEIKNMSFNGDNKDDVLNDCLKIKGKYKNYDDFIRAYEINKREGLKK